MGSDKKPTIRFAGFTEAWEQRKVSDITTSYSGGTPQVGNLEYYHGNIPFIRSGEIHSNKTELFITQKGINNSSAKMVSKGDILYALYGATSGEVSRAGLHGAINQAILAISPNEKYNADFLVEWLRKEKKNIIDKYLQGGQGNLSAQIIKNLVIYVPSSEEQDKIGLCFLELNHLITLHQRKCDKLVNIKKSMLEKMFPKNGSNVPEIRFAGFTEAWEQRKFGELIKKYEDSVEIPTDGYMRLGIKSHAKGTFHSYVEAGKGLEAAKMFKVAANNFIVNITFGWEHAVAITDEDDAGKLVSHRFPQYSFNEGMIPQFFRYLILDESFKHHLELSSPGGAGRNRVLKLADMLEYKITFPKTEEQNKIASYFDALDKLITLHQSELEKLKLLKKAMLKNMFV